METACHKCSYMNQSNSLHPPIFVENQPCVTKHTEDQLKLVYSRPLGSLLDPEDAPSASDPSADSVILFPFIRLSFPLVCFLLNSSLIFNDPYHIQHELAETNESST